MTDSKHKDCEFCRLVEKVFGHKNCAQLVNEMTDEALNVMNVKVAGLREILLTKFENGELTSEESEKVAHHLRFAMAFTAAAISATMITSGPCILPSEMVKLVEDKINSVVAFMVQQKFGINVNDLFSEPEVPKKTDSKLN